MTWAGWPRKLAGAAALALFIYLLQYWLLGMFVLVSVGMWVFR